MFTANIEKITAVVKDCKACATNHRISIETSTNKEEKEQ